MKDRKKGQKDNRKKKKAIRMEKAVTGFSGRMDELDKQLARKWVLDLEEDEETNTGKDTDTSYDCDYDEEDDVDGEAFTRDAAGEASLEGLTTEQTNEALQSPTLNAIQRNALGDASLLVNTYLKDIFKDHPGDVMGALLLFLAHR